MDQFSVSDQITKLAHKISSYEQQYGRDKGSVKLLAVSKTRDLKEVKAAIRAGQTAFGENYAQELVEKASAIGPEAVEWHFIGPLQSNKAKFIAEHADWIHTIDRLKTADKLNRLVVKNDRKIDVCIQLNIDHELSKAGIGADAASAFAQHIEELPGLTLRGLMCIPKAQHSFDRQREVFAQVRKVQEQLIRDGHTLDTLSFGMSNDYEAAIAEGATIVRIGTAIFGARPSS